MSDNIAEKIKAINSPIKKKVLVVEDNSINAFLMKRILVNLNFEVQIAENGQMGFDKTLAYKPDLVLMDINMPVLNGFESTKLIRTANDLINNVPIFAVTAEFENDTAAKVKQAGMNEYIRKPIEIIELEQYILKYLH
jgi:CheY-like chemotaxis protein